MFYLDKQAETLTIELNIVWDIFGIIDPNIYVSYGEDERPFSKHYDWKSENFGDDMLVISKNNDPK